MRPPLLLLHDTGRLLDEQYGFLGPCRLLVTERFRSRPHSRSPLVSHGALELHFDTVKNQARKIAEIAHGGSTDNLQDGGLAETIGCSQNGKTVGLLEINFVVESTEQLLDLQGGNSLHRLKSNSINPDEPLKMAISPKNARKPPTNNFYL